jgi:hypothetical protein
MFPDSACPSPELKLACTRFAFGTATATPETEEDTIPAGNVWGASRNQAWECGVEVASRITRSSSFLMFGRSFGGDLRTGEPSDSTKCTNKDPSVWVSKALDPRHASTIASAIPKKDALTSTQYSNCTAPNLEFS